MRDRVAENIYQDKVARLRLREERDEARAKVARRDARIAALATELVSCKVFLCAPATKADRHAKVRSIETALSDEGEPPLTSITPRPHHRIN